MITPEQNKKAQELLTAVGYKSPTTAALHAQTPDTTKKESSNADWFSQVNTYKPTTEAPKESDQPDTTMKSKALFKATGDESALGAAGKTLGNIPGSTFNFGKGVIEFLNPLNTVKTAKAIGTSFGEAEAEGQNGKELLKETVKGIPKAAYEVLVPQFLKHIFSGDLKSAAATIENDPVGQIAPLLLIGRETAIKAGKGAEFDAAVSKIASPATKAGSKIKAGMGTAASQVLAAGTGTGASSIKVAAEGTKGFTDALRGKTTAEDVVNSAHNVVQNIKTERGNSYRKDLESIGENTKSHDISTVHDELKNQLANFNIKETKDGLDFSRSSIANNGSARADIQGVVSTLKDWGTQTGDRTGVGLDILKKQLADFYSESSQARSFVQAIKSKVSDVLNKEVPGYQEMTGKYAKASQLLDDIKSATGAGSSKAKADTVFTKLTSAMKGDKEFRLEVLKEMEKAGEPELMDKIAGVNMQSWMPKGLIGKGLDYVSAFQILRGAFSLKVLPMLLATSPRIVGEFVRALGIAGKKAQMITDAVNKLAPLSLDFSPLNTAQNTQGQEPEPDLQ